MPLHQPPSCWSSASQAAPPITFFVLGVGTVTRQVKNSLEDLCGSRILLAAVLRVWLSCHVQLYFCISLQNQHRENRPFSSTAKVKRDSCRPGTPGVQVPPFWGILSEKPLRAGQERQGQGPRSSLSTCGSPWASLSDPYFLHLP